MRVIFPEYNLHSKKSLRKNTAPNVPNSAARGIIETNEKLNNHQENKAQIPPEHKCFYTKIRESTEKPITGKISVFWLAFACFSEWNFFLCIQRILALN